MKVWISKYALTNGVLEIEARVCDNVSPDMIEDINEKYHYYHYEGRDWHRTRESALTKAEQMRKKKIASLETQIEKLRKLRFE